MPTGKTLKPIATIFNEMQWCQDPDNHRRVGLVSSFVKAVKMSRAHVGSRVALWNKRLPASDRVQKVRLLKPGKKPWVGSRTAFLATYKTLA